MCGKVIRLTGPYIFAFWEGEGCTVESFQTEEEAEAAQRAKMREVGGWLVHRDMGGHGGDSTHLIVAPRIEVEFDGILIRWDSTSKATDEDVLDQIDIEDGHSTTDRLNEVVDAINAALVTL